MSKVNISVDTEPYNDRRYGKPWIATVTFEQGSKATFHWGDWIGRAGEPGVLELQASVGDVVATGQKDFRNPRGTRCEYSIVEPDGSLTEVDKVDAYKHWKEVTNG